LLVYGGGINGGDLNDTWQLTLAATPTWTLLTPPAWPPGRQNHIAVLDGSRARMIVQGGQVMGSDYCCDLIDSPTWAYDLALGTWQSLDASIPRPSPRANHAGIHDPIRNRLVIAGDGPYGPTLDLWSLDLTAAGGWTHHAPAGPNPPWLTELSAIYDPVGDRMVIFGGWDGHASHNEVWALSLSSMTWVQLTPSGTLPAPRRGHMALYDGDAQRMLVIGGTTTMDTWELTLGSSPAWNPIVTSARPPFYTPSAAMLDPYRRRVVAIGVTYPPWMTVAWALNLSGPPAWTPLSTFGFPPVFYENGNRAIYDPIQDRMLVSFDAIHPGSLWGLNFSDFPTPTIVSVVSAEALPHRVRVTWQMSEPSGTFDIERASAAEGWHRIGVVTVDAGGRVTFEDSDVIPGGHYGYRLSGPAFGSAGETWLDIPAELLLSLRGAVPNPSSGGSVSAALVLPAAAPATLELLDPLGRRVASREVGSLGAGPHVVSFERTRLAPGIYLVRLTQGGRALTARAVVLR
jgi:hypothetical protein